MVFFLFCRQWRGCLCIAFVRCVGAVLCLCWQWRDCLCVAPSDGLGVGDFS